MDDVYQQRYVAHQQRKKATLIQIMQDRHSDRHFSDDDVPREIIDELLGLLARCPSSCDRHGVYTKVVDMRDDKELLGGLLVGGVGWVHRAKYIVLFFADPLAYKAGDEAKYMPYLDAGVMVQQLALLVTASELAGCFINPNVRPQNVAHFRKQFGDDIFCGAFAIAKAFVSHE